MDADKLGKLNPDVLFCKLDCFSGVRRGTRADYIGYDDLVEAITGIRLRFGGAMDRPEEHALSTPMDDVALKQACADPELATNLSSPEAIDGFDAQRTTSIA